MNICIIGAINYDHIILYKGKESTSLGGILYNVFALSNLLDEGSRIYPISRIGEEHISEVKKILSQKSNVDIKGLGLSIEGTNENILRYISPDKRIETLESRIRPIEYEELEPYLDCDLFLFNFISGFEITLEAIRKVKEDSHALVFIDVHNKVFGMKENGERYPQIWKDWREWLCYADIVQMNEEECGLVVGQKMNDLDDFIGAAIQIMEKGPSQVLITLGSRGSVTVYRESEEYYYLTLPITTHRVVDTTGCGDSFAAGYIYSMVEDQSPVIATAFANVVAGENCEVKGSFNTKSVIEIRERMDKEYPQVIGRINKGWKGKKWEKEKEIV